MLVRHHRDNIYRNILNSLTFKNLNGTMSCSSSKFILILFSRNKTVFCHHSINRRINWILAWLADDCWKGWSNRIIFEASRWHLTYQSWLTWLYWFHWLMVRVLDHIQAIFFSVFLKPTCDLELSSLGSIENTTTWHLVSVIWPPYRLLDWHLPEVPVTLPSGCLCPTTWPQQGLR